MPLRILLLTNRVPYPLHDGGALAMDAMISGYAAAGLKVYLLAMNTSRHSVLPEILAGLYGDIAGFYTVDVDNTVSRKGLLSNLLFSREPEHATRFKSNAFATKIHQLLHDIKPDVVQLESPFLASYLPAIRKMSSALFVYRMHNAEGQIWTRLAVNSSGVKRAYLQLLAKRMTRYEQRLWRDADLLLPITRRDAIAVKEAGIHTPIEVAPFGIHTIPQAQKLPPGPFKVYHIGAMDWLPNAEGVRWFLKEVWPKLHAVAPELTFHFAGRAMPLSFHKNLPLGAFCAGEVADANAFIRDKHILVVPIRSGSGIRIKTLEAMAAGKLVVSTDTGMQGIDAQPHLHYLNAATAQEFIHLIAWASDHREKAQSITNTAQRFIHECYDADAIMNRVVSRLYAMRAS